MTQAFAHQLMKINVFAAYVVINRVKNEGNIFDTLLSCDLQTRKIRITYSYIEFSYSVFG